ncbi:beta-hexosaminidase subunit beta-like [Lutzomyia longipalpis]|uniref:Beta-hexosaminidase n=1 Tax=Lutzomyia longipalpis TaxID=7200 RepID=A0A7G3ABZ1_LUTLO|nr:beta-hexosaminidase subunit beta-like [Lutzomyia longipalpis]
MRLIIFTLVVLLEYISTACGYIVDPGPVVIASRGLIWPQPKNIVIDDTFSIIRPQKFEFNAVKNTCDILNESFIRYKELIVAEAQRLRKIEVRNARKSHERINRINYEQWSDDDQFTGFLESLTVNLEKPCEDSPYLGMDESYKFTLNNSEAVLESESVWGILRGLESFSQMITPGSDGRSLMINSSRIEDEPRFSHRGLLLDTSRHFIPLETIKMVLNGMAYNKLNVFHWHIVDDHSFPYESTKFPELSAQGAYHPTLVYTQNDVAAIIEYARLRGIRVLPEFDTPGHTRSWGVSHPELLTTCYPPYIGKLGPIDPTKPAVYDFLRELFGEISHVFPEQYFHLGGDEVGFECWSTNPEIVEYMKSKNYTKYEQLEEEFIQKVVDIIDELKSKSIVWQEVYQNQVRLPQGTVVHVWTGDRKKLMSQITRDGLPVLLSACWYLDHLATGGDWTKFYSCDPLDFSGTPEQKALVMGGEACMWAEVVDDTNVLQRIFPRASAAAERLWSQSSGFQVKERLEEHACRLRKRNIPAQPPNGPGYCL